MIEADGEDFSVEYGNPLDPRIATVQGTGLSYTFDDSGEYILALTSGTITSFGLNYQGNFVFSFTGLAIDAVVLTQAIQSHDFAAPWDLLLGGNDVIHGSDALLQIPEGTPLPGGDNIIGLAGNDLIYGYAGDDTLLGGIGRDTLYGGDGFDALIGGKGNDALYGGRGADFLIGGAGNDAINGSKGSDYLIGGIGNDTLNGGDGFDFAMLGRDHRDITVDLRRIDRQVTGDGLDKFVSIEGLVSTGGSDHLIGNDQSNVLLSAGGRDMVSGGGGNDLLSGSAGNDTLSGDDGADVFAFWDSLDPARNVDTILDFAHDEDRFALDPFTFLHGPAQLPGQPIAVLAEAGFALGTGPTTADHRVIYDEVTGQVFYDPDGTGDDATELFAMVAPGTVLSASDFTYENSFAVLAIFS